MKKSYLILVLMVFTTLLNAQIRGTVIDGEHDEPFIGVTVLVQGTEKGTSTDIDGKFSLNASVGDTLIFSFVGYKTDQYVIRDNKSINFVLHSDQTLIDEVIVVGYGVQKKSDVTGAVASIKPETIENRPNANLIQSLQGSVAGLNISVTGSNAEGSATTTRIRGNKSITASNKPLTILDGIPYIGNWAELNPNDIESIEVLKDASSAAIYGARGSNGVILIQTKRGKKSGKKLTVSYDGNITTSSAINIPKMMDGKTFYERKKEAGHTFTFTESQMHDEGRETDWLDLALRTGFNHQHNLSLRGSGEGTRYFISANYSDNKGIALNDKYTRTTFRINVEQDINDYITIGTNTSYGFYDRSGVEADFNNAYRMNPLGEAYDADGNIRFQTWEDTNYAKNPLSALNEDDKDHRHQLITNNFIDITLPLEGLKYKLNTGYTYQSRIERNYQGRDTYEGNQSNGSLRLYDSNRIDWIIENILSYNKTIDKHNIFLTALYSAQSYDSESNTINASGFPNDVMTYYQPNMANLLKASASLTQTSNLSQMLRANYSFDSRYLITATARRDGFSAFGEDTKYGIFPSIAVGWNITNEGFMENTKFTNIVTDLKLRLSWGKNGNEAISSYASLPVLRTRDYLNDDYTPAFGFYPSKLASPDLGWESTTSVNIGLDFGLLSNRISGALDFYTAQTYDLLLSRSIPAINGTNEILENIGKTEGSGIEFQISSTNISGRDFRWSTDFNINHHKTKIVDVGLYDDEGKPINDMASKWFIGYPVSINYDYVIDGIYQEGQVPPDAPFNSQPGYVRYEDLNGDGQITPDEDQKIIGSRYPDFTAGLNNIFSYKNLSLSFFLNASVGETRPNFLMSTHSVGYRRNQLDKEFWTPDNPINTYPSNVSDGSVNPRSAYFYEKTDFLRIQDVSLSYKFPGKLIKKIGVDRLQVYGSIKNLYTFTNWGGLDPEFVSSGSIQRSIPQTRQFTFGFRTSF